MKFLFVELQIEIGRMKDMICYLTVINVISTSDRRTMNERSMCAVCEFVYM